jgi:hypothetical protein
MYKLIFIAIVFLAGCGSDSSYLTAPSIQRSTVIISATNCSSCPTNEYKIFSDSVMVDYFTLGTSVTISDTLSLRTGSVLVSKRTRHGFAPGINDVWYRDTVVTNGLTWLIW